MSGSKPVPLVIHGWTVFADPLFLAQLEALAQQAEAFRQKDPIGYVKKNASKRPAFAGRSRYGGARATATRCGHCPVGAC